MKSGLFASEPLPPAARRAMIAGFVGFAVDFFDIYLPALVLAPVMSYFEPKGLSSTATTTIYYFTIVATLLGRPCGAVIFGHWADKIGRRRTTMISIAGFGIFTALIAFLPSDAAIGVWSLILLIVIRFVGGVFMGGEYTSNNTLALEMVPRDRRGFVGGLIQGAFPVGFAADHGGHHDHAQHHHQRPVLCLGLARPVPDRLRHRLRLSALLPHGARIDVVGGERKERGAAEGRAVRQTPAHARSDLPDDDRLLARRPALELAAQHHDPAFARAERDDLERVPVRQHRACSSPSSAMAC